VLPALLAAFWQDIITRAQNKNVSAVATTMCTFFIKVLFVEDCGIDHKC